MGITLLQLFEAVKEEHLSKDKLELYRDQLSSLFAEMSVEMAGIEKAAAIFFYERTKPDVSDISIKREWQATASGQRQILLKRYLRATEKILSSLKSRLYNVF